MPDNDYVVATRQLFIGYALAHNAGDLVPAGNVKANGWEDGVAKVGTKAASAAQGVAGEQAAAPATKTSAPPPK